MSIEQGIVRTIHPHVDHPHVDTEQYADVKPAELARFCHELREIMELEVQAGNGIVETHAGWPNATSIFICLRKRFSLDLISYLPALCSERLMIHIGGRRSTFTNHRRTYLFVASNYA